MPILDTDINLMASERMHDEEDGGGRMSGNQIVNGESNNMFPDVSQLDRTYGRLNLRKTYEAVLSDNTETFFGSNIIVSKPPSDSTIHCTLFKTSSDDVAWVDERDAAQDKMERYITRGQLSPMVLLGTHYEGQRALLAYQKPDQSIAAAGEIYTLVDDTNDNEQFVKITAVATVEVTYVDPGLNHENFDAIQVTLTISDPLEYQFEGGVPYISSGYQPETELHKTNAIPAVSYYGIQPLAIAADFDDREVIVESYKGHLLPSTQTEEPLLDVILTNSEDVINTSDDGGREVTIAQVQETTTTYVGVTNRDFNYVKTLFPKPAPGTVHVTYRAKEKWYTLVDTNGDGQLQGDGSGSVNYETGTVLLTVADYPDVDTRIIFGWGSPDSYERNDTIAAPESPTYTVTVNNAPILPTSITITWESGAKSVTDDGAGALTGDGTGTVQYASGVVSFSPTVLPAYDDIPEISYTESVQVHESKIGITPDPVTGLATIALAEVPAANTVSVTYSTSVFKSYIAFSKFAVMDGDNLGTYVRDGLTILNVGAHDKGDGTLQVGSGTIDYSGKSITIDAIIGYRAVQSAYNTIIYTG